MGADALRIITQAVARIMDNNPEASADDICEAILEEMRRDELLRNAVAEHVLNSLFTIAGKIDKCEPLTDDERERWQEAMGSSIARLKSAL
jgi:hypothetical protein